MTSAPGARHSALGALPVITDTCGERGLRIGPLRSRTPCWTEPDW
ncbi:hypothetical protein ACIQZB_31480 [Streptomyces sp. NPDC097727]